MEKPPYRQKRSYYAPVRSTWPGFFIACRYCCFGAAGGLAAGAIVSAGLVFLVLVLVSDFDFVFFFGVGVSAAGA
jgi:hypothetical protein